MTPRKEKESVPPNKLRCNRSDGKQWRCKGYKVEGKSLCEKHLSASRVSVVKRTERREEEPDKKRRIKYIARSEMSDSGETGSLVKKNVNKADDLSEPEEDKPPETKIRRNGKGRKENETVTSLRMMKDSLGDPTKVGGVGDKKKYMYNEGFRVKKKRGNEEKPCSNLIKSTEKCAKTECSSSKGKDRMKGIKMISQEEEEHGDGERVSRVVKKGVGCDFKKSRLKGKNIQSDEENNCGNFYDSKRKHSAKSREPIAKGVENGSLLKKVEVALEKQDDDDQNNCTNPKGKKNGEVTRRSDKGKNKKVDLRRKHFSADVSSFALLQI